MIEDPKAGKGLSSAGVIAQGPGLIIRLEATRSEVPDA
jgi:hypothetical protein